MSNFCKHLTNTNNYLYGKLRPCCWITRTADLNKPTEVKEYRAWMAGQQNFQRLQYNIPNNFYRQFYEQLLYCSFIYPCYSAPCSVLVFVMERGNRSVLGIIGCKQVCIELNDKILKNSTIIKITTVLDLKINNPKYPKKIKSH